MLMVIGVILLILDFYWTVFSFIINFKNYLSVFCNFVLLLLDCIWTVFMSWLCCFHCVLALVSWLCCYDLDCFFLF